MSAPYLDAGAVADVREGETLNVTYTSRRSGNSLSTRLYVTAVPDRDGGGERVVYGTDPDDSGKKRGLALFLAPDSFGHLFRFDERLGPLQDVTDEGETRTYRFGTRVENVRVLGQVEAVTRDGGVS